jgi:acyl-CoA thioesterase FadM
VRLDDLLVVEAFIGKIGTTSIHIDFEVRRKGVPDLVATGRYVVVAVGRDSFAPVPVPDIVRERLESFADLS